MDPRTERTRNSLQDTLLELARDSDLDNISVAQIVTRAGVNRSSFYQHYSDKDVLLADALERQLVALTDSFVARELSETASMSEKLSGFLAHVRENAEIYRRALGPNGSPVVVNRLNKRIEAIMRQTSGIVQHNEKLEVPTDLIAGALAGAILAMVVGGLRRDPLPEISEMEQWISIVLEHPLNSWLGAPEASL